MSASCVRLQLSRALVGYEGRGNVSTGRRDLIASARRHFLPLGVSKESYGNSTALSMRTAPDAKIREDDDRNHLQGCAPGVVELYRGGCHARAARPHRTARRELR